MPEAATILFLAANPVPSRPLSLDEEARDIEERIRPRSCRVALVLRTCWAVRPGDVQRALNETRPAIVHFSGHGSAAMGLMLHDASGVSAMMDGFVLRQLFSAFTEHLRLVVLNACYSEEQAEEIRKEVDCVVGMRRAVSDKAAKDFSCAFYQALAFGQSVRNAFEQGRGAMSIHGAGVLESPRLLARSGVDPAEILLDRPRDVMASPPEGVNAEPGRRRFVIRLEGSVGDMNVELLAKLTELLQEHSGDLTLRIHAIKDGSVRLTVEATPRGRARLHLLLASRQLTHLAGFEILAIEEVELDSGVDRPLAPAYGREKHERVDSSLAQVGGPVRRGIRHSGGHGVDRPQEQKVEAPRLVAVFDGRRPRVAGLRLTLADVDEVLIGRDTQRQWSRADRRLLLAVPDRDVSRRHVRLSRHADGWNLDDLGSKNGTIVDGLRTEHCTLADGDLIEIGCTLFVYRDQAEQRDAGDRDLAAELDVPDVFRTLSIEVESRVGDLIRMAPTQVPVLIRGETGTGKDLLAQAVHVVSRRRGRFVPADCGALPRALVGRELFGYRGGAFSGARDDRGLAGKADGGTLFLDNVADLREESQVALLRLLQEGEVRPIGSADLVKVDVRVIAATQEDLPSLVADGRFRPDLYARLSGHEVTMPPLRDRSEDIGSIIALLLRRICPDDLEPSFTPQAAFALLSYPYPMNVPELEQALAAAVALAGPSEIGVEHLPSAIRQHASAAAAHRNLRPDALRLRLVELFRRHGGNIDATAHALDKAPGQVRRWCRQLGIDPTDFRPR